MGIIGGGVSREISLFAGQIGELCLGSRSEDRVWESRDSIVVRKSRIVRIKIGHGDASTGIPVPIVLFLVCVQEREWGMLLLLLKLMACCQCGHSGGCGGSGRGRGAVLERVLLVVAVATVDVVAMISIVEGSTSVHGCVRSTSGPSILIRESCGHRMAVVVVLLKTHVRLFVVLQERMKITQREATTREVFAVVVLQIPLVDISSSWG